jgi:hypothetical protein
VPNRRPIASRSRTFAAWRKRSTESCGSRAVAGFTRTCDDAHAVKAPSAVPSATSSSRRSSASGSCSQRWIARLSGRAPKTGSYPSSREERLGPVGHVEPTAELGGQPPRPASWSSTILRSSASSSGRKTTMSSIRFRNSGRKWTWSCERTLGLDLVPVRFSAPLEDVLTPDVRGHDDDHVPEVDGPPLRVGEPSVVEDLQQHVEHLRVRLLDLVEEDHRVRPRRTASVSWPPSS